MRIIESDCQAYVYCIKRRCCLKLQQERVAGNFSMHSHTPQPVNSCMNCSTNIVRSQLATNTFAFTLKASQGKEYYRRQCNTSTGAHQSSLHRLIAPPRPINHQEHSSWMGCGHRPDAYVQSTTVVLPCCSRGCYAECCMSLRGDEISQVILLQIAASTDSRAFSANACICMSHSTQR